MELEVFLTENMPSRSIQAEVRRGHPWDQTPRFGVFGRSKLDQQSYRVTEGNVAP